MIRKKGVSDVVNTILLIVVIVLAVGVVSIFIFNFLSDNRISLSDMDLTINKIGSSYNNDKIPSQIMTKVSDDSVLEAYTETVYVSVERGSDGGALSGFNFIFEVDGNTYSCLRRTTPRNLETQVYAFQSSIFNKKPDSLKVVPVVIINNVERMAKTGYSVDVATASKIFTEKIDECGGFCCGANPELPPAPARLP